MTAQASTASKLKACRKDGIHLLILDDDPSVVQRIELLLGMYNYCCTLAATGQQDIGRYDAGEFILIITDLRLLDMMRLDILQAIKRSHPHCQVIQRSNYSSIDNAA